MDIPDYLRLLEPPEPPKEPEAKVVKFDREELEAENRQAKLEAVTQLLNQMCGPLIRKVLKADDPELLRRKELVRQGDAEEANNLAYEYYMEHRIEASEEEAEEWLRMGRSNDESCSAEYLLYLEYTNSANGNEADPEKAMYFLRMGAEKGYPNCCFDLGEFCFKGEKVERDIHQAIKWLGRGAERRNKLCIIQLIEMYLLEGSAYSLKQALKWCWLLVNLETPDLNPEYFGYHCYLYGYALQQSGDLPAAIHWYERGVQYESGGAAFQLALIYERGEAGEPDHQQAMEWLRWMTGGEEDGVDYLLEALDCACQEHDIRRPRLRKFLRKGMEEEKDGAEYLAYELLMLICGKGQNVEVYIGPDE